ncbi:MAG: methyltransferase domain-containing protein [Gammaproteobacteria bacterium]|nr:methyltransferase domain-containing protein [Gammaproteobacteria bacterium]
MRHKNYGWQNALDPNSCNYITPKILELAPQFEHARILDLGCGNGALCHALMRNLSCEVVGIEYDEHGARIAQESNPGARIFNYGVQDNPDTLLTQVGDKFDLAVSTEVIEHLYSPQLLPQYAARVLKPHGRLIVSTPYHGYLKNLAISLTGHWDAHHTALWEGGHIKFWSKTTLSRLMKENGFSTEGFYGIGRLPWLWKSMVMVFRKD